MSRRKSIVLERTFILATRDTGYKSTAAAVAELVDNALQARARHVDVLLRDDEPDGVALAVVDDGIGMNGWTLRTALCFGGSTRFDDRQGQGRFGMGLPNSSVSQARQIEVYSWRARRQPIFCYLDVDEIADGRMTQVPAICRRPLPNWTRSCARRSGTCVVWRRCDRLDCRRRSTLCQRLHDSLGQWFRYFIWSGVSITVDGEPVAAIDPLFLRREDTPAAGRLFGEPLKYELRLPHAPSHTATVTVRFVELPLEELHDLPVDDKRKFGIVKSAGVSVVRAGREIDYGWYLMGEKRKENYDDWWRCEIAFGPELDEYFGVTHSKQGVNPSASLRSALSADLGAVAHKLNARVRKRYAAVKAQSAHGQTAATRIASRVDRDLPRLQGRPVIRCPKKHEYQGLSYRIATSKSDGREFFTWRLDGDGVMHVLVNQNHPFYSRLYEPLCGTRDSSVAVALECLLLSAARAEASVRGSNGHAKYLSRHRQAWSDALAVFLGL